MTSGTTGRTSSGGQQSYQKSFWTVSGDYDIEFEPDTEKYVYSKQTVLYRAVKQVPLRYFRSRRNLACI